MPAEYQDAFFGKAFAVVQHIGDQTFAYIEEAGQVGSFHFVFIHQ